MFITAIDLFCVSMGEPKGCREIRNWPEIGKLYFSRSGILMNECVLPVSNSRLSLISTLVSGGVKYTIIDSNLDDTI